MNYFSLNVCIIAAFLIINLIVGLWAGGKSTTMRDYALANKSYGTGPLVMTYLATIIGGGFLFGSIKDVYDNGIGMVLVIFGIGISMFIRAVYIAPRMLPFRNCLSLGDIIGELYGNESKVLAGVLSVLLNSIVAGLQISGLSFIFKNFVGLDPIIGVVLSGLVLTIYSSIGGMKAVTSTDMFQFVFLIVALAIIAGLTINKAGGGEVVLSQISIDKFNITGNKRFYFYLSIILTDIIFLAEMVNPPRLDRMLMAKSPYHLKKMLYISGVSIMVIICVIALFAFSVLTLYPGINSSDIIPKVMDALVPNNLKWIVIIGFIAVLLSSGDSYIHSAGVSFAHDIAKPITERYAMDFNELRFAKFSTCIVGLLSICFAIWGNHLSRIDYAMSIVTPTLAAPLLLGILGIKPEKKSFWYACLFAVISFICCKIFLKSPYESFSLFIPCCINAIVYMISHIHINGGIMLVRHIKNDVFMVYKWKSEQ